MPRRQFLADFEAAQVSGEVEFIDDLKTGDEDGQFTFSFDHPLSQVPAVINALVSDVGDYPRSHEYFIFMADDAPQALCQAINSGLPSTRSKTVIELLKFVSSTLVTSLTKPDDDKVMPDSQDNSDLAEEDSEEDESEGELDLNEDLLRAPSIMRTLTTSAPTLSSPFRRRLNNDLRAAKSAGFKVGHLGPLTDGQGAYITISCRIKKLGISEEAMQAWKIEPDEYLILLIQYSSGYKPLNILRNYSQSQSREYMQVRVGASKTYKPTIQEAILAFERSSRDGFTHRNSTMTAADSTEFRDVFISKPLSNLMNERLLVLLKLRGCYSGMEWSGAEQYYNELQGASDLTHSQEPDRKYLQPEMKRGTYPAIVSADHFEAGKDDLSFPLLAMQFLLRHFVRCTEFCLICHRHLSDDLQAIKPYVCDKPLCLYQYMSLGFGPSIEHEITAQPYVVDLLVSFCYLSAMSGKLKHFPTGLSIMVPPLAALQRESTVRSPTKDAAIPVKVDIARQELLFPNQTGRSPIKQGDWIVVHIKHGPPAPSDIYHCRVVDVSLYPSVRLDQLISANRFRPSYQPLQERPPTPPDATSIQHRLETSPKWADATVDKYNVSFDELELSEKQQLMVKLLDTVPGVKEMQEFLVTNHSMDLKTWLVRISPSALALLRWIIASNRACIMQIDDFDNQVDGQASTSERIHGMPNWAQFRFAMGAPDKEQRFVKAVRQTSERLKLEYPTLFAWHGSPVQNWHSIIREGLNFNETAHGRAYGHGVYHSLHYATSFGYAVGYGGSIVNNWPPSLLRIKSAMSLNEIVNAPSEFVSSNPHLVVAQLDWIQTRYLFVQRTDQTNGHSTDQYGTTGRPITLSSIGVSARATLPPLPEPEEPKNVLLQDPKMTPFGETVRISIPAKLGTSSHHRCFDRVVKVKGDKGSSKIRKVLSRFRGSGTQTEPIELDEDNDEGCSVATLEEDRALLVEEPTIETGVASLVPKSNFVPGTLDHSKLPRMPEPSYANITATKRLQADFKALLKVQNNSSPEELGWYIDPEKLDNVYQWIVELHTFEAFKDKGKDIPLVEDMKKRNVSSIVLELRFPGSYPMSPPFVRVIRPRFMSFQQGGGGHVTAGGALCMELLTNSGWSAVSSIEAVLLQVRMAIASTDPYPARLSSDDVYGVGEAIEAYKRACMTHGWQIPPDFASLAQG
ncbi:hypothetical protein MBLNU457_4280t1 [Dothideomycetes sp. NU457]